jgi:Mg-chelatase subunit ChlI
MSTKLLKTLTAAHLNALNASIGSLETQVTALKTTLKELGGGKGADAGEEEEEETPPAKKRGKKAAAEEVEEEESDDASEDESEEDESEESEEDESEDEEESEEEEAGPTRRDCIQALKAYAAKHKKSAAMAKLKKLGVDSVYDLKPAKYPALLKSLKV